MLELTALNEGPGTWHLVLEADRAILAPSQGGPPILVPHSDTAGHFDLVSRWGSQAVLAVPRQGGLKKLRFRLTPAQSEAIDQWLNPRSLGHLGQLLRRRYAFGIPVGLLVVLASLPMSADPASGMAARPASPLMAVGGLGLVATWMVARFRPTPRLLLVDSIWAWLVMADVIADVVSGKSSVLWLAVGLVIPGLMRSGLREYRRYRHLLDRHA